MSSVLFALEIVVFVLVVYWAYANDPIRPSLGENGVLGMVSAALGAAATAKRAPNWQRSPPRAVRSARPVQRSTPLRTAPRWSRTASAGQR